MADQAAHAPWSRAAGVLLDRAALGMLTAASMVLAVAAALAMPVRLYPVPFSLGIPFFFLVNLGLAHLARGLGYRSWPAFLPMIGWLVVVAVAWAGGPGGDAVVPANTPHGLVLLVLGTVPSAIVYWRATLASAAAQPSATG
jgi:hypothetical protein